MRLLDKGVVQACSEDYFLERVGGAEFFKLYGPRVVKPVMAYALKRAALEPGLRALDAGCGRGEILYQLRGQGVEAVGIDIADAALKIAADTTGVPVLKAKAGRLPFKGRSFDRVFFLGVLDHLPDEELKACFSEFKRVLKPGGFVLANTCTNTEYHKNLSYASRRRLAALLGLKEPEAPGTSEDQALHVNEHSQADLERFLRCIRWGGEIEPRPNEKCLVRELYGEPLPADFPLKPAAAWKRLLVSLVFRGPLKRFLAREFFCKISPVDD